MKENGMVFDFLRRAERVAPEQKASATGRVVAFGLSGRSGARGTR
jgi:hypothetical protein